MSNHIPERLINYRAYQDGVHLVGTVDVELPSFEALTDTIQGAGVAGELDTPTLGHFGSMTLGINWRTIGVQGLQLAYQQYHALEFRGAQQLHDASTGQLVTQPVRVAVRAMPKSTTLGTGAVSASTDSANEFEVSYIRIDIDNKMIIELDKLNFKFNVRGQDLLQQVRAAIGMN